MNRLIMIATIIIKGSKIKKLVIKKNIYQPPQFFSFLRKNKNKTIYENKLRNNIFNLF